MKNLSITIAANITYSGFTYNTKLLVEYKHTGKEWVYRKKHSKNETITSNVKTLGEEADLEAQTFSLSQKPIGSTNVEFSTKTAFLPNVCYNQ